MWAFYYRNFIEHWPFLRSRSRTCTFRQWISWKAWDIRRKLLLPSIASHIWLFFVPLAYLPLTLLDSKGQGQEHVYFYNKYLWNGDFIKNYYCHQIASFVRVFVSHIYILLWPSLKDKVNAVHISTMNVLEMLRDREKVTLAIN